MPSLRVIVPLAIGLLVGGAGAVLFLQSMPPAAGSDAERAQKLEAELKKANNRLAALEGPDFHKRGKRTLADGARNIMDDIREGKPVTPDDIFRAMQPFIRDFSPLFDRMRVRQMEKLSDTMAGEMARKYSLNEQQQSALREWMNQRAAEESKRYFDLASQEGVKMEDLAMASQDVRIDDGLETFMPQILSGDKLAAFKTDRMQEKSERVQAEADRKVERLNQIVQLDDSQRNRMFGLMARGSRDFDPAMRFEGLGEADAAPLKPGTSQKDAMLAVLTPAQKQAYEAERQRQRDAARKDMEGLGLNLPDNWQPPDMQDF